MIELTECKYTHPREFTINHIKSIVKAIEETDLYSFEPSAINFKIEELEQRHIDAIKKQKKYKKIPAGLPGVMYFGAIRNQKYLYFLERKKHPEELDFIKELEQIKLNEIFVSAGLIDTTELKTQLENTVKKANENLVYRDNTIAQNLDNLEKNIRTYFTENGISLPEKIRILDFRGAYHVLEYLANEKAKNKEGIEIRILIPDLGSQQEKLNMSIIAAQSIPLNKRELIIIEDYAKIMQYINKEDSTYRKLMREYFEKTIDKLESIKGKKIDFEQFQEIMQEVKIEPLYEIKEKLEKKLEESIMKKTLK